MLSKLEIEKICILGEAGKSKAEIAKEIGVSSMTVLKYLKLNNIKRRAGGTSLVNENYFNKLESDEVQYWIGWIISDGNLYDKRVCLAVTQKDIDILEKYCKFLNLECSYIKTKKMNNKNWDKLSYVRFGNLETYNFLKSIGITEKKSKTISINIPMTFSILRGIIEGDGCIGMYRKKPIISISSASIQLISQISDFLWENNIKNSINKNGNCYSLAIICLQAYSIVKNIYPSEFIIHGNRKYNKALEIIKHYDRKNNKNISC